MTPAEFVALDRDSREDVYWRYLVKDSGHVIVDESDEDDLNPEIAKGVILRQEHFVGSDAAGRQIAEEAREVYYTENSFYVRSHWLCEFLVDALASDEPFRVEGLIRRLAVTVDLRHVYDDGTDRSSRGREEGRAVRDLKQLMGLEKAEWIGIYVVGGGAANGSDLATQQKIKEISGVVQELIERFQGRLTIRKVRTEREVLEWGGYDLRRYWEKPTARAKRKVVEGTASFEELMQVQMEEWTRKVSATISPDEMYRESLL